MLSQGEVTTYRPGKGTTTMKAQVISPHMSGELVEVRIASDPFPSWVRYDQLTSTSTNRKGAHKMPPATKTAKTLRSEARRLGIEGWEDMDRDELEEAIANFEPEDVEEDEDVEDEEDEDDEDEAPARPAKKASKSAKKAPTKKAPTAKKSAPGKKAPASKKAAPKRTAAEDNGNEGPNPFREGSNLFLFTEALMRGGKRSQMVTKLERKVDLKPRVRGGRDYDTAAEIDYRLVRVCQLLANEHDFTIEKEGRGTEQKVKAIPPR